MHRDYLRALPAQFYIRTSGMMQFIADELDRPEEDSGMRGESYILDFGP